MRHSFILITLLALSFAGCKVKKSVTEARENEYGLRITYTENHTPLSIFTGQVYEKGSNEKISSAQVFLRNNKDGNQYGAQTNEDGEFMIKGIQPGHYTLLIKGMGYETTEAPIEIKEQTNCKARLVLKVFQVEKPIIYLYPTQQQFITVRLNYEGMVTHTYPKYPKDGWKVLADTTGTLRDDQNQEYYGLFWEGEAASPIIPKDGFVIPGRETISFLEQKLAWLGLNRREANEFIIYWAPRLENNPFNFIHFSGAAYEEQARLEIDPQPETLIRVMMLTKPLSKETQVPVQDLSPLRKIRKGYTVVEWGGCTIPTMLTGTELLFRLQG